MRQQTLQKQDEIRCEADMSGEQNNFETTVVKPTATSPRFRILVAEDDAMFRALLRSWLTRWGYEPIIVADGNKAWNVLQQQDAPKIAILDWMMPGISGPELCHQVRGRTNMPYVYLLLLTAKTDKQDVIAGLGAGADDFLSKPFDADELQARIRTGHRIVCLHDELIMAGERLRFQATHDTLTGLWNRAAIFDNLHRELERSARMGHPVGVAMADIDHFKEINDTYGHQIGDVVLHEVAQRIASAVRVYDTVGRYGGEEFLVVLPGIETADITALAERLRASVGDSPISTPAGMVSVTISIGGTGVDGQLSAPSGEAILHDADAALYEAKREGRNCVRVVSSREQLKKPIPIIQDQVASR